MRCFASWAFVVVMILAAGGSATAQTSDNPFGKWSSRTLAPARQYASAIYDPARDRMVVFGGSTAQKVNETWAFPLAGGPSLSGRLTTTGTRPSARWKHTAVYDSARDRMIVFGGEGTASLLNDVWALSLSGTPAWTPIVPAGTPPAARVGHAAVYDPNSDRMIVFGGWDGSPTPLRNDVWALELSGEPRWVELLPGVPAPRARYGASAVYDPLRDLLILFGGASAAGEDNALWSLSLGDDPVWTHLFPGGADAPQPRREHGAAYDAPRSRMIVFGGYQTGGVYMNDVWSLDFGSAPAWRRGDPSGALTTPRAGMALVHDPVLDRTHVFSGIGPVAEGPVSVRPNWFALSWSPSESWTTIADVLATPSGRYGAAVTHGFCEDSIYLVGGWNASGLSTDVWEMSTASATPTWTPVTTAGTPPFGWFTPVAMVVPSDNLIVLDACSVMAWALDFCQNPPVWREFECSGELPAGNCGLSAVEAGMEFILYGGGADLWRVWAGGCTYSYLEFDRITTTGDLPPAGLLGTLAYDDVQNTLYLYAGDVWSLPLSGSYAWTHLAPAGIPPDPRTGGTLLFDHGRRRLLLFGGESGTTRYSDTWWLTLTGTPQWTRFLPAGDGPTPRSSATGFFHVNQDRAIFFGGSEGASVYDGDTWLLKFGGVVGIDQPAPAIPAPAALFAHPNPASSSAALAFTLSRPERVDLRVFDVQGRLVRTILGSAACDAGLHRESWDGKDEDGRAAASGTYICVLRAGESVAKQKIVLSR